MEFERDILDAPLETRDRLVLDTMRLVYRELQKRPHWYPGYGMAQATASRAALLGDWMSLVYGVRDKVEGTTIFNDEISRSDWPDIPACLVLGVQAFLERKAPREPPPQLAVETWKLVCSMLTVSLLDERQHLMEGYLGDFIKRQRKVGLIGPAFDPVAVMRQEAA
jgi:hypothetical protein